MPSDWDDHADGWDDDPAPRAYADAAFGSLRALLIEHGVPLAGADVCDFGAGTGLLTERMIVECRSVDAVDKSPRMLAVLDAKIARRGWLTVRTMSEPVSTPERYDLVVCSSVCGFLPDYPATVAALVPTLRPGGVFVQWDWEADAESDSGDGLTRAEIRAALVDTGLESVAVDIGFRAESGGMIMAPLMGCGRVPPAD